MSDYPNRILIRIRFDYDGNVDGQWIDADAPKPHSFGHYHAEYVPAARIEADARRVAELEGLVKEALEINRRVLGDTYWRTPDNTLWPDLCEVTERLERMGGSDGTQTD
jgi:hypothetical protein